jgi:hypothetical protein
MRIKIDNDIYFNKDTLMWISIQTIRDDIDRCDIILNNTAELSFEWITDIDELIYIKEQNQRLINEKANFTIEKNKLTSLLQEIGIDGY